MILFNLRCTAGHTFEAWFRNGDTYDRQANAKAVACPVCGTNAVEKALMAPRISKGTKPRQEMVKAVDAAPPAPPAEPTPEMAKAAEMLRVLREARRLVEQNCDYVGKDFAEEARKIHYGETDRHNIYGESTEDEARALAEEGIEFGRIPWVPVADQ
ncbi:hypothetical protein EDC65_1781 [Stella humosa]|uniref:DUF1178 family protein n=1 Tax=Stella humosa TaxID=94 RepID=A0A3N1MBA8_9PROT|nr:DUF1178 family protein [Stella humosa]ROP99986.1 hypothetical protein EDC65_1781 [Stella humosa]BBK30783.1 hypothetical protein STHU_14170 [Stella humosa]